MSRVAVVGAGIVGKRVVDAICRHNRLELAGVAVRSPGTFVLARPGLTYFAADDAARQTLAQSGVAVQGTLPDMLVRADTVIDCGPARSAGLRAGMYRASRMRAVFCGGERDPHLGPLVHPAHNPERVRTAAEVRLMSCNTTALARLSAVVGLAHLEDLDATVIRCCTDTDKASKGITNGALIDPTTSHHAADLAAVAPALPARSTAVTVPMTSGHVIHVRLRLRGCTTGQAVRRLARQRRFQVVDSDLPIDTAAVKAAVNRPWHNRYEVLVQPVRPTTGNVLQLWMSLDNEAVTVPEAIDVLHLMSDSGPYSAVSANTDAVLGVGQ